ncbi:MAG TPA: hypothetical protein VH375_06430 [Rhodanobacteraceae bacterium]
MQFVAQAVLWAAAIFASAILDAPPVLSGVLLPALAASALISLRERRRHCI